MIYTKKKTDITNLLININDGLLDYKFMMNFVKYLSILKNNKYSIEEEWRMICLDIIEPGIHTENVRPTKIYLGSRSNLNQKFRDEICSIAADNEREVWQMKNGVHVLNRI